MDHFAWNYEDDEGVVRGQGCWWPPSCLLVRGNIPGVPRIIERATLLPRRIATVAPPVVQRVAGGTCVIRRVSACAADGQDYRNGTVTFLALSLVPS